MVVEARRRLIMSDERKSLLEKASGDSLAEGAAHFDRLVESAKLNRMSPRAEALTAAPNPLLPASPGEAWAKQFQTQSIGPDAGRTAMVDFAPLSAKMVVIPPPPEAILPERQFAPQMDLAPPSDFRPEKRFGTPERPKRRSWLRRLFSDG
ncbi:MAG TPA: hypothetical protein VN154_08585 [Rhizomicrobium sp.]|nr:hypothetical protein [Rhizomicrobium sp.]